MTKERVQAFAGFVIGGVVLILVTAILASAVTTAQVAGDLKTATNQLEDIRKADAKAEQARVERSAVVTGQLTLLRQQNAQQAARDRLQRRYLARLSKALRSHGIPVPNPPRVTVTVHPKAPRPTSRATPTPTAPGPRGPGTDDRNLACSLVPALCPFLPLSTLP